MTKTKHFVFWKQKQNMTLFLLLRNCKSLASLSEAIILHWQTSTRVKVLFWVFVMLWGATHPTLQPTEAFCTYSCAYIDTFTHLPNGIQIWQCFDMPSEDCLQDVLIVLSVHCTNIDEICREPEITFSTGQTENAVHLTRKIPSIHCYSKS